MPDQDRWRALEQLFDEAVELDVASRAALLDRVCAADPSLRAGVERLLAWHGRAAGFLERPPLAVAGEAASGERAGARIGPYRLVRELGRGGMGAVYLAERDDEQYRHQVAIKLVKGGLDTEAIVRRFRSERQMLATLNHPNITKLLDGGTSDDGLPYFVLEYVDGVPIDQYCEAGALDVAQRLALFGQVCAAVDHAHRHLIVHRDIKAGNILVGADGVPKLLDFGIAKWLDPEMRVDATIPAPFRPMTPEYASPEQVSGGAITTATDVYSLGVLLYRLTTGRLPLEFASHQPHAIANVILEQDPRPPSEAEGLNEARRRRLRGDLDSIVLKTLRKDPADRYGSVEQLSQDVHRYLTGLPVLARKGSLQYRVVKFVRRHKTAAAAGVGVLLTLAAGVSATTWEAHVAQVERGRAERRLRDVRQITNSLIVEFNDALATLPGSTATRALLARRALEYLDELAKEVTTDASLQRELAVTYQKVGDLQGLPYQANLGDTAGARASYQKSVAILERLSAGPSPDTSDTVALGTAYQRIGSVLTRMNEPSGALANLRKALQIRERLVKPHPDDRELRQQLAESSVSTGDALLSSQGDTLEAMSLYDRARAIRQALLATTPDDPRLLNGLAESHHRLGAIFETFGDLLADTLGPANATKSFRQSLAHHREAMVIATRLLTNDANNMGFRRLVADATGETARLVAKSGSPGEAVDLYRPVLTSFESLAAADPANQEAGFDLSVSHRDFGVLLERHGDRADAERHYRQSIAISERTLATDPTNGERNLILAGTYAMLGDMLAKSGNTAAAEATYRKIVALGDRLRAGSPPSPSWRIVYGTGVWRLTNLLDRHGRAAEAAVPADAEMALERASADRTTASVQELFNAAQLLLTCRPVGLRDPRAAVAYAERAVALTGGKQALPAFLLVRAYYESGDVDKAVKAAHAALALLPTSFGGLDDAGIRRQLAATLGSQEGHASAVRR